MLHILLMILKIIGIILLVILGLLLLIVLSVLFVPVRYQGKAEKAEKSIQAQAGISWLLHIISVTFDYTDGTKHVVIRIFGINLQKAASLFKRKKQKKVQENPADNELSPLEKQPDKVTAAPSPRKTAVPDIQLVIEEKRKTKVEKQDTVPVAEKNGSSFFQKICRFVKKMYLRFLTIMKMIIGIPKRIWALCKKIALTIRTVCAKISQWKTFLKDEKTKAALLHIRHEIMLLLKHIRPRKVDGYIEFGLEDPYETGQILAGLGMLYPVYGNHIKVNPQFDHKVLNGHLGLKGRIYVFMLLRIAWHIYKDKNVKFVIHNFHHKEE